jgi:hypothetical protein
MLQMFCEMVNIVLDTSQRFGIISHTEQAVPLKRVPVNKGGGFNFIDAARLYLTRKTHCLVQRDRSQVTILSSLPPPCIYPNLPESLPRQS